MREIPSVHRALSYSAGVISKGRAMKVIVHVVTLPDDKILVQFRFDVRGNHLISCGIRGSFCVEDFGSFPIAVAKILLDSKVASISTTNRFHFFSIREFPLLLLHYVLKSASIFYQGNFGGFVNVQGIMAS